MIADDVNVKAFCFMEEKLGNLCFHYIHGSESNQQCGADATLTSEIQMVSCVGVLVTGN
jgi:hypothetical protein